MASWGEFLQSIRPGMKLDREFFLRAYGYEISYPGSADKVIGALEIVGCSRAREYYNRFVGEYEKKHDEELKGVAHWYAQECEKRWEGRVNAENVKRRNKPRHQFAGFPEDW